MLAALVKLGFWLCTLACVAVEHLALCQYERSLTSVSLRACVVKPWVLCNTYVFLPATLTGKPNPDTVGGRGANWTGGLQEITYDARARHDYGLPRMSMLLRGGSLLLVRILC